MAIQSDNNPELTTLEEWKGLNQQSKQGSIDDQEEWWNENLFRLDAGNLRSCWGKSAPIYTAPSGTSILRIFFGYYGNQTPQFGAPPPGAMGWMFLSDGTIDEVDLNTQAITSLRTNGNIWNPIGPQWWASAKVWRPQFFGSAPGQQGGVLFGSPEQVGGAPPGGLYAWDGTTLTSPGQPAPDWLTDLQETNPGGTIPNMPTGLPGIYCMEVWQSRLWVAGKDVISFSAPSNGADFSTINGGGSFGYFGDKLVYSYMALYAQAGYMFVYGDSSIDLISNIQLSGNGTPASPYTTNFSYQNVDPQIGQRFPRPVGPIGRDMMSFNGVGVFRTQGADAQPISDKVNGIWGTLDTSLYLPTFAPATIFGFRVLLCNGRFTDPWGVTRNVILIFHPVRGAEFWSCASQSTELTNIGSYEQDSVITPYGTDGTSLYRLFDHPDELLTKRLVTKQLRGKDLAQLTIKNWNRVYAEINDNDGRGVMLDGNLITGGGGVPGGRQRISFALARGEIHNLFPSPTEGSGIWGALDISSNSPDFSIQRLHLTTHLNTLFGA